MKLEIADLHPHSARRSVKEGRSRTASVARSLSRCMHSFVVCVRRLVIVCMLAIASRLRRPSAGRGAYDDDEAAKRPLSLSPRAHASSWNRLAVYFFLPMPTAAFALPRTLFFLFLSSLRIFLVATPLLVFRPARIRRYAGSESSASSRVS